MDAEEDIVDEGLLMTSTTIGEVGLSFVVRGSLDVGKATGVDLPEIGGETTYEHFRRASVRRAMAASEALEAAWRRDLPGVPVEAVTEFDEPSSAGPGALPLAIAAIVLHGTPAGDLAALAGVADGALDLINWLREHNGVVEHVDDGIAFLVAWQSLRDAHPDVSLLTVKPVRPAAFDWEGEVEGYLVAFRDEISVYEVPVALDGSVGDVVVVSVRFFSERRLAIRQQVEAASDETVG
jgi:hypothetical protein